MPSGPSNLSSNSAGNQEVTNKFDLNDPETLSYFSEILLFVEDKKRTELSFPANLSLAQRRTLMTLCAQFGVCFNVQDQGGILITKQALPAPQSVFESSYTMPSSSSATNLSSFAQPLSGLQQPQPILHSQSSHQNLLYQQQQQQTQYSGNHNVLRGTKSFADIRAPTYSISTPGTPGSPFFPPQTPPPQHPQNNLTPLSISLQQQRGFQYHNPTGQQPKQQVGQQYQQYQSQPFFTQANQNENSNSFMQYGSSFGPTSTGGVGAMTDSFSSLLNIGGHSLSRVPSVTNISGSLTAPGSVGSNSPTGSISSMHPGLDEHTTASKLSSSFNNSAGVIGSKLTSSDANTNNNFNDSNEATLNND